MRLLEGTEWDQPPTCDRCGRLEEGCDCPPSPKVFAAPEKQKARLAVERRKKGKLVTVVRGLSAEESDRSELLIRLKASCGAGGALKDGLLEIQGNHLDRVRDFLAESGCRVRG
jgi:translation initiation factor 1